MNEGYHLSRQSYGCIFREMIVAWRNSFENLDAPFVFVQLHSCDDGNAGQCYADFCNYGDIRLAQSDVAIALPRVGFAVSYDQGHVGIHSPHKAQIGRRVALKLSQVAFGNAQLAEVEGPALVGACVLTPPRPATSHGTTSNKTEVKLLLSNAAGGLHLSPTQECSVQSPTCCNGTVTGLPGTAPGLAQIAVGDVWRGSQWYDATMSLLPRHLDLKPDESEVLLCVDLGEDLHPWGVERCPVWQVRFAVGAYPSCAVSAANGIPLAPFGPVPVAPACTFAAQPSFELVV